MAAALVDADALAEWLAGRVDGLAGPLRLTKFAGGQSNPTYRVDSAERTCVLRCKPGPAATLLPSAHAIEREYRVMQALQGSAVPLPSTLALCEDEAVIGRVFYLMDFVPGRCFDDNSLPGVAPVQRGLLYDEANRVLAALHALDPAALGLADFGKAAGFLPRQIARWTAQYHASATGRIAAMDALIDWLPAHLPDGLDEAVPRLLHGDFKLDNLVFHPTEPRVLAVLDWELATLGPPVVDLAYHCLMWRIAPGLLHGLHGLDLAGLGIPDETAYLAAYAARRDMAIGPAWSYCLAYNFFRLAAIFQGIASRAAAGRASHARAGEFGRQAEVMAGAGWAIAREIGA